MNETSLTKVCLLSLAVLQHAPRRLHHHFEMELCSAETVERDHQRRLLKILPLLLSATSKCHLRSERISQKSMSQQVRRQLRLRRPTFPISHSEVEVLHQSTSCRRRKYHVLPFQILRRHLPNSALRHKDHLLQPPMLLASLTLRRCLRLRLHPFRYQHRTLLRRHRPLPRPLLHVCPSHLNLHPIRPDNRSFFSATTSPSAASTYVHPPCFFSVCLV